MILLNNTVALDKKHRCISIVLSTKKQKGFSLFITLIALVVMSLAAAALIRSVDTNTVIAGNLAFKQTATASADAAVETAIAWLEANNNGTSLDSSNVAAGYSASISNNPTDPVGVAYWDSRSANACILNSGVCSASAGQDASGNTSEYLIERLCATTGGVAGARCVVPAGTVNSSGNGEGVDDIKIAVSKEVYYRIIVKVTGPRNTTSYVQTIVSLA
jgi:type IV pilus assembly protein PilX